MVPLLLTLVKLSIVCKSLLLHEMETESAEKQLHINNKIGMTQLTIANFTSNYSSLKKLISESSFSGSTS